MPKNTGWGSRHAAEFARKQGRTPERLPNGGITDCWGHCTHNHHPNWWQRFWAAW